MKDKDELIARCYTKPHYLYDEMHLKRLDITFMDVLFKLEDEFLSLPDQNRTGQSIWFFTTDENLHKLTGISKKKLCKIRQRLVLSGLIQCKQGWKEGKKAMNYRIMVNV